METTFRVELGHHLKEDSLCPRHASKFRGESGHPRSGHGRGGCSIYLAAGGEGGLELQLGELRLAESVPPLQKMQIDTSRGELGHLCGGQSMFRVLRCCENKQLACSEVSWAICAASSPCFDRGLSSGLAEGARGAHGAFAKPVRAHGGVSGAFLMRLSDASF